MTDSHECLNSKFMYPPRPYCYWNIVLSFLIGVMSTGCSLHFDTRVGRHPDLTALNQRLRLGESTIDDVLAALGPPVGKGKLMLPVDTVSRSLWSYYYSEGFFKMGSESDGEIKGLTLFVFFDEDRYNGYMWFSSLTK